MKLTSEILAWDLDDESSSGLDLELRQRAHEIWRHARERLNGEPTEFDRTDSVCALKRAVNHRLKSLSSSYSFDCLPHAGNSKKGILEKYQHYGIVRPALVQELLIIRNDIEHNDLPPPEIELCKRYLDFVWYFLKSTDSLLYLQKDNMIFSEPNNLGEIGFDIEFESPWNIRVSGDIDEKFIIIGENDDAIIIDEEQRTPAWAKNKIYGTLRPTADQLEKIARLYFSMSGFCWDDHLR